MAPATPLPQQQQQQQQPSPKAGKTDDEADGLLALKSPLVEAPVLGTAPSCSTTPSSSSSTPASCAGAPDLPLAPPPRSHLSTSLASQGSLPEGVTPHSLSDSGELVAAVAGVRARLREEYGEEEGEKLLPTGFIVQCLRSRSGVVEEAAVVARNFLRFRRQEAQWPLRLRGEDVAGGPLESGTHWILPGRDAEGRGVLVFNVGRIDTSKGSLEQYQKMGAYVLERFTREEDIQRQGVVMVVNLARVSFPLYGKLMSPRDSRRAIHMWQEAFPCKLKRIYVVGASPLMTHLLQLVVALLGKKLRSRVRVLSHIDDLTTKEGGLPPAVLPPELGGTLEGWDWGKWCKGVLASEEEGSGGEAADPVWGWD